jgi:hypothetical protein
MMQVVKCALLQILVVKNAQHIDKKYAVSIIFCSCIHLGLDWDEQNNHLLENQYFQLLPHYIVFFILEYYLGWSQAQMPCDLATRLATPSETHLSVSTSFFVNTSFLPAVCSSFPIITHSCPILLRVRKSTLQEKTVEIRRSPRKLFSFTKPDLQFNINFVGSIVLIHIANRILSCTKLHSRDRK